MSILVEIIVSLLLIGGGLFALTGAVGLVKLPDCIQRLHAPTKAATLGVGGVLIASSVFFTMKTGSLSFHEVLVALFILMTAPITANFIAKVYIESAKSADELPKTGTDHGWAIYDDPPKN
jgi:multicomponent K+:H+ antiporter subunit G